MFLGGAVLPPHGRSGAEHGTRSLHRQTHHRIAKHAKDFVPHGSDLCWCSKRRILLQLHVPENCRRKADEGGLEEING